MFEVPAQPLAENPERIPSFSPGLPRDLSRRSLGEDGSAAPPGSYLTKIPKAKRRPGQGAGSAKHRSDEELQECVREWVKQKFDHPKKIKQRKALFHGQWTRELVVHNIKHPEELDLIRRAGITVHNLSEAISSFRQGGTVVEKAAGADFVELVTGFD